MAPINVRLTRRTKSGAGGIAGGSAIRVTAGEAEYAKTAGYALEARVAERADYAERSGEADHAAASDEAQHAQTADLADMAKDLTADSPAWDKVLRKDRADRTPFALAVGGELAAEQGIKGKDFAPGVNAGYGWRIDKDGNGELESLVLRRWLEVPEVRYNRAEVIQGVEWHAPGGGIVEWISVNADGVSGEGQLKLEDGEAPALAADDLCMGIWHFGDGTDATEDSDDRAGAMTFAGFTTVYFRIEAVDSTGGFLWTLREGWPAVPQEGMHFVAFGNTDDPSRQKCRYATREYERYMSGVNTWEFSPAMTEAVFGDLTGMTDSNGMSLSGYSAYLNNVYFSGVIQQVENAPLRLTLDTSGDPYVGDGRDCVIQCRMTKGFEDVAPKDVTLSVTCDSGAVLTADAEGRVTVRLADLRGKGSAMVTVKAVLTDKDNRQWEAVASVVVRDAKELTGPAGAGYTENLLLGTMDYSLETTTGVASCACDLVKGLGNVPAGTKYTVSFEYEYDNVETGDAFNFQRLGFEVPIKRFPTYNQYLQLWIYLPGSSSNLSGRGKGVATVEVPDGADQNTTKGRFYIQLKSGHCRMWNFKIEEGENKTPVWTPNPADLKGVGWQSDVTEYAVGTDGVTKPTGGWQATVPAVAQGGWLWTRTTTTYTDGSKSESYSVSRIGKDGADGVTITQKEILYAKTAAQTQPAESAFTATAIAQLNAAAGDYVWCLVRLTYSDGDVSRSYSVSRIGADGDKGNSLHIAYASDVTLDAGGNATAVTGFSTTPFDGYEWMGTYADTDGYKPDSGKWSDYAWTKVKGDTGKTGKDGKDGKDATGAKIVRAYSGYNYVDSEGRVCQTYATLVAWGNTTSGAWSLQPIEGLKTGDILVMPCVVTDRGNAVGFLYYEMTRGAGQGNGFTRVEGLKGLGFVCSGKDGDKGDKGDDARVFEWVPSRGTINAVKGQTTASVTISARLRVTEGETAGYASALPAGYSARAAWYDGAEFRGCAAVIPAPGYSFGTSFHPQSMTELRFQLYKGNCATDQNSADPGGCTLVAERSIPVVLDGESITGPTGAVLRGPSEWSQGSAYYAGGTEDANGIKWRDIVYVRDSYGNRTVYLCIKDNDGTTAPEGEGNSEWKRMSDIGPLYASTLYSENAKIDFLSGQEIIIHTASGAIIGRLGGGDTPLYLGGERVEDATYVVKSNGCTRFGLASGRRVVIDPDTKTIDIYGEDGKVCAVFSGVKKPVAGLNAQAGAWSGTDTKLKSTDSGELTASATTKETVLTLGTITTATGGVTHVKGTVYATAYPGVQWTQGSGMASMQRECRVTATARIWVEDSNGNAVASARASASSETSLTITGTPQRRTESATLDQTINLAAGTYSIKCSTEVSASGYHAASVPSASAQVQLLSASNASAANYRAEFFGNGLHISSATNDRFSAVYEEGNGMYVYAENVHGYGIAVEPDCVRVKHHGGRFMPLPEFVFGAYLLYDSTNNTWSVNNERTFDGNGLTAYRTAQGTLCISFPAAWKTALDGLFDAALWDIDITGRVNAAAFAVTALDSSGMTVTMRNGTTASDESFVIHASIIRY